jgi:hypothetical protein
LLAVLVVEEVFPVMVEEAVEEQVELFFIQQNLYQQGTILL